MHTLHAFAIIGIASLIHASFQLSVSVLTLMSGHALSAKRSHSRLLRLMLGYIAGVATMTLLVLSFLSLILVIFYSDSVPQFSWTILSGLLVGLGLAVWIFYYRRSEGTSLWIPRSLSRHLISRSKATKLSVETFGLGLVGVLAELLFTIGPLAAGAFAVMHLPSPVEQLSGLALYMTLSLLPLLIVAALVGGGHKLSTIQRWRESNKRFMQFASGAGLLALGFYLYVEQVLRVSVESIGSSL